MTPRHTVFAMSAVLAAALVARGTAQSAPPPPQTTAAAAAPTSTTGGVYTEEQATKGGETYMNICVSCHAMGTYVGQSFKTTWGGRPVADLFAFISTKMPEDDPGSLTPKQYADVIAYMLKINKLPVGKTDLPAEMDALKLIRLDLEIK